MSQVVEQFKDFYQQLDRLPVRQFELIYDDGLVFRDPVHEIRGASELLSYLEGLCANMGQCQFEYLDQLLGDDKAYIKWNMHFSHPRLGERVHTVRGASHIQFNERIHYHEDMYDMGQLVYEHLPVLGTATRWVKRRMAG